MLTEHPPAKRYVWFDISKRFQQAEFPTLLEDTPELHTNVTRALVEGFGRSYYDSPNPFEKVDRARYQEPHSEAEEEKEEDEEKEGKKRKKKV